jgi:hypothetical protein
MNERKIDIEAKIFALLELSKSTAEGTEHESKSALEMAIRLAAKHGISLSSLSDKRQAYAGNWYKGAVGPDKTHVVEYTTDRFAELSLKDWCELVECFGWERHRRSHDDHEGLILAYRQPDRIPKLEVRVFERPWLDVEFEVVRNPDPTIGKFDEWMRMTFDVVELGVTYHDFKTWLENDKKVPVK